VVYICANKHLTIDAYRLCRPAEEAIPAAQELEVAGGDAERCRGILQPQVEDSKDLRPWQRHPSSGHGEHHNLSFRLMLHTVVVFGCLVPRGLN
jgi:hypothetical protein